MASTITAAKTWILTQLQAVPDLNDVQITYGGPTEADDVEAEMIFFESPTPRDPSWQVLARPAPLDEDYTLNLRVQVKQTGDDEPSCEQRVLDIVAIVEDTIRADLRLGGLLRPAVGSSSLEFGEQSIETSPHSDGWLGRALVPLHCHART